MLRKNIIEVPIVKGSVPYNVQEKYKAASVMLHHANE
jgi:ribosomal protein S5